MANKSVAQKMIDGIREFTERLEDPESGLVKQILENAKEIKLKRTQYQTIVDQGAG